MKNPVAERGEPKPWVKVPRGFKSVNQTIKGGAWQREDVQQPEVRYGLMRITREKSIGFRVARSRK